ncbi:hypothetical protein F5B20DRAFT_535434 [Whalleya microplaca]|nr:hypothetical protein F5B20DRAFT_535434 [Whalleya microplaca]
MSTKWYHDPALYEYLSTDMFWVLGIIIGINAYWTNQQVELFIESEKEPKAVKASNDDTPSSEPRPSSQQMPNSEPTRSSGTTSDRKHLWLQPHITSRPRQILAVVLCSLVVPMQLLEGYWVIKTAWRVSAAMFKALFPQAKLRILSILFYLFTTVVMLAAWAAVLGLGILLLSMQVLYVLQLRELQPGASARSDLGEEIPGAEKKRKDDGEWDELEDAESAHGGERDGAEEQESLLGAAKI